VIALPNTANTVANWPLQGGSLADISGNGLDLTAVDARTEAPKAATVVSIDATTQAIDTTYDGVTFNAKLKLDASRASLLRFTGAFTIQWVMVQVRTFSISHFCCVNPDNITPHRDGAPDRIGSLYDIWSTGGDCEISDQNIGSNLPVPFYGAFPGTNNATWAQVPVSPPPYAAPAAFALTRDASGNYHAYRNGVLIGSVASAGTHTVQGNEVFYIGGTESGVPPAGTFGNSGGAQYANVRALNYARSSADIAADVYASGLPGAGVYSVSVSSISNFAIGSTYYTGTSSSSLDAGSFTVEAINATTGILTVLANGGWTPTAGHFVFAT